MRLRDLFKKFTFFSKQDDISIQEFNKKLKEIEIISYISNGVAKVDISTEELHKIAEDNHWLHELDDPEDEDDDYENGVDENNQSVPMVLDSVYANLKWKTKN